MVTEAAVKERPILFSGPMVRALLDGRKTQTRRIIKPMPPSIESVRKRTGSSFGLWNDRSPPWWRIVGPVGVVREIMGTDVDPRFNCPYGEAGDRLWVRESWSASTETIGLGGSMARYDPEKHTVRVWYASDNNRPTWAESRWRPSIHMPRWASRITLEVTEVRAQPVQDVSEDDAIAEGFPTHVAENTFRKCYRDDKERAAKRIACMAELWDKINSHREGGWWDANPWVWAVSFKVVTS